jgi:hypothetical protein
MFPIKVQHGEVTRRLVLQEPYLYQTLLKQILSRFELSNYYTHNSHLLYFNQDGELVSMSTDAELSQALALSQPDKVLRLRLMIKTSDDSYETTDFEDSATTTFLSVKKMKKPQHSDEKTQQPLDVVKDAGHVVKFVFENDMYKIKLETLSFASIQQGVANRLGNLGATPSLLRIRYRDSDGDEVSIANESDLAEALREQPGALKLLCSLKKHADHAAMARAGTVPPLSQRLGVVASTRGCLMTMNASARSGASLRGGLNTLQTRQQRVGFSFSRSACR